MGRTEKSIIEIEGMAIVGLVEDVALEDCREPEGWKRIVVVSLDGQVYETRCIEPQAAKRNFMVISSYAKRWSKQITGDSEVDSVKENI